MDNTAVRREHFPFFLHSVKMELIANLTTNDTLGVLPELEQLKRPCFYSGNFTNFSVSLLLLHQHLSHTGYDFVRSVVFPVKRVNPDFHSQGWTSTDQTMVSDAV